MTLNYLVIVERYLFIEWSGWQFEKNYETFSLLESVGRANGLKFTSDCPMLVIKLYLLSQLIRTFTISFRKQIREKQTPCMILEKYMPHTCKWLHSLMDCMKDTPNI